MRYTALKNLQSKASFAAQQIFANLPRHALVQPCGAPDLAPLGFPYFTGTYSAKDY
jgi:hypothetical protein